MTTVLVTGAVGNVGREVVRSLIARNIRVIGADRRLGRVDALFGERVVASELDFANPATWKNSLQGAEHMFLVRPPAISDMATTLIPFVDYARDHGVQHVVFLSVAGAGKNSWVPHRAVEDHLLARGGDFTNLRPGFFAQNLQTAYLEDIRTDDRIYVPAGRALVNWVDVRDVADVAALVFTEPQAHWARSYTLTGPGPVSWQQVVSALSRVTGRTIRYEPASIGGYMIHLMNRRAAIGAICVQTLLHFLLRFDQGAGFDPAVELLLGRPARSVEQYIDENAAVWRTQAGS